MEQVKLYDTTLRDGMGGHGMSLSAPEKLKRRPRARRARRPFHRGRLPQLQPEGGGAVRAALPSWSSQNATVCAFGMTRRRDVAAEDDAALPCWSTSFAPVVSLVGKAWALHLEKVTAVSREENLAMIADSVAFCVPQGKRVVFDAEHFFDGYRDDPAYALECLSAAVDAGRRERHPLRHQRRQPARLRRRGDRARSSTRWESGVEIGIHTHNDAECGVANSLAAVRGGARLVQGNDQRLRRALRQRQPGLDPAGAAAEDGLRGRLPGTAREPHLDRPLPRRALQHDAGPRPALRRPQRLRPQGGDARRWGRRRREHLRAHRPEAVGNARDILASELSGKATIRSQAERAGLEVDDEAAARAVERLKEREHRGYHYEAAPASFELLLRREAGDYKPLFELEGFSVVDRGAPKGGSDRGDDRSPGRRQPLRRDGAEGNGPVNALDRALRGRSPTATRTSPRSS